MKGRRTCWLAACLLFVWTIASNSIAETVDVVGTAGTTLQVERVATFDRPWAMTFLPDGNMLVTEKSGKLLLVGSDGKTRSKVSGVPKVAYGGQGGLGDIIVHPKFSDNQQVYFSYAEGDQSGRRGAAVARAKLDRSGQDPILQGLEVVWRQIPKVSGRGHYSHRLAFGPDDKLYITSGERQKGDPAQSWNENLGKIIRLNPDGSVPPDNPFQGKGELAKSFWTLGHRNMLGLAFGENGRLWATEMGPRHGDELNSIEAGENYGWPLVSWGNHYSGLPIADHDTRPEFKAPAAYWVPTIAPSGLIIYSGNLFTRWRGNAFIGGLASQALIRVEIDGDSAREVERFDMGQRIREVEEGPDGVIWLLEDGDRAGLLKLTPRE
ncbi:PQQ-dependent sugar dehydrogenase [Desulfopila aestuarii]|uniref:Glucose/arabinose dehydrogenase, beta-propeller fold n=1 Tax=Desulfopila aestuarii DSM 18488 TaxID=1121416 RepID=A0A1M7Y8P0_9BACT|nr:PQQ-dependent sugar dehydrogenase [Desulfopila aestuarii]SHO48979.1 Glucose/arabinose dehydrogenase, beta-propeller fold [Desulfopila aestuarii DSM 18488]